MDSKISSLHAEIRYLERELIHSKIKLAQSKADLDTVNLECDLVTGQIDQMFDNTATNSNKASPNVKAQKQTKISKLLKSQSSDLGPNPISSKAMQQLPKTRSETQPSPMVTAEDIGTLNQIKSPKPKSSMNAIFNYNSSSQDYANRTYSGGKQYLKGVANMFYSKMASVASAV